MTAVGAGPYTPRLQSVPDARATTLPVVPPILLGYVAFLVGAPIAALGAAYNAVAWRRPGLFVASLAVGLATLPATALAWVVTTGDGGGFVPALGLVARAVHLGLGILLARLTLDHHRAHKLIDGRDVPILPGVLVVFGAQFVVPNTILFALLVPWSRLVLVL